jgi:UDP-3-O-[3-hydroxymyristoyl] N-acetylglucosamine deacetylase
MDRQHTIAKTASHEGVGLHTGALVRLTVRPAEAGKGVVFVRTDVKSGDARISAHALKVSTTQLGTNLTNEDGVSVATVEHFLAACAGLGVDNLVAELDGPELPILDGSSAPFVELLMQAGIEEQGAPQRILKILKPVEVRDGVKFARLSPGAGFEMRVAIDFAPKAIGRQTISFAMKPGAFTRDIAWARTFGFASEVEALRAMGKALGGSMDNAIVVDGDAILNEGGLKVPDEFVRHKLLDVIGDLFLAGGPIEGLYEGEQPGHALNNRLLRALFADTTAFEWGVGRGIGNRDWNVRR